ncbi:MAG: dTDP-4-dehydrorhamnose 3,5-epimerase family protein [Candidatus Hodarchaeota archaeon]
MYNLIEGVRVKEIKKFIDDRGYFSELVRTDWSELIQNDSIVQINLSHSYPNIVRAWHRHLRGQIDYFICIKGAIKVCAYDDRDNSPTHGELDEIILSDDCFKVARIPGILWHGYKVLGINAAKVLYLVTKLYKYDAPDEERRPWNDKRFVPKLINGKTEDSRVGKTWDWNYTPNR